jgi:hypothetical protein
MSDPDWVDDAHTDNAPRDGQVQVGDTFKRISELTPGDCEHIAADLEEKAENIAAVAASWRRRGRDIRVLRNPPRQF